MKFCLKLGKTAIETYDFSPPVPPHVLSDFVVSPAWKLPSNLHEIFQCRMYSRKLLMMGEGNAQNM